LPNVEVSTIPPSSVVVTSDDGSFYISEKVERDTTYQLKLSKHNYKSASKLIGVGIGELNVGEMLLERDYDSAIWLVILFQKSDRTPLKNAQITINLPGTIQTTYTTDSNGIINTTLDAPKSNSDSVTCFVSISDGVTSETVEQTFQYGQSNTVTITTTNI
jgi:hypothetical protein